jgi:hypothetical protein
MNALPMMPNMSVTPLAAIVSTNASLGVIRGIAVSSLLPLHPGLPPAHRG